MFSRFNTVAAEPLKLPYLYAWAAIGVYLIIIPHIMFLIGAAGVSPLNIPLAAIAFLVTVMLVLRVENLTAGAFILFVWGFLTDQPRIRGMFEAGASGLYLLYRAVVTTGFFITLFAIFMAIWPMELSDIGAFWVILACGFGFLLWDLKYRFHGKVFMYLSGTFLTVTLLAALWSTFNDPLMDNAFDPYTREPAYMVDSVTKERDPLDRKPAVCRPSTIAHFGSNGSSWPHYADPAQNPNACISPSTGNYLVPVDSTVAMAKKPLWQIKQLGVPSAVWMMGLGAIVLIGAMALSPKLRGVSKDMVGAVAVLAIVLGFIHWIATGDRTSAGKKYEALTAATAASIVLDHKLKAAGLAPSKNQLSTDRADLPQSIQVPHCDTGLVAKIDIPRGKLVSPQWSGNVLRVENRIDGRWKPSSVRVIGELDAAQYCTTSFAYANDAMPLVWSDLKK